MTFEQALLSLLSEDEWFRNRDLARVLGVSRQATARRLRRMVEIGWVKAMGHGASTRYERGMAFPRLGRGQAFGVSSDDWKRLTDAQPNLAYVRLERITGPRITRQKQFEEAIRLTRAYAFRILDFEGIEHLSEAAAALLSPIRCAGVVTLPINMAPAISAVVARARWRWDDRLSANLSRQEQNLEACESSRAREREDTTLVA
jgi:DNA-binding IclR family transcriptional regulator